MTPSQLEGQISTITRNSALAFAGSSVQLTLTQSEPVTVEGTAILGTATSADSFEYEGCFQSSSMQTPAFFYQADYLNPSTQGGVRQAYSDTVTETFPAGAYRFGLCVYNNGSTDLNNNDYVNGTVTVYGPTS